VPLASDQQLLLQEISAKLDGLDGSAALASFMGQVLRSLLRRKGDSEFLATIQDTFIAGMAERGPDQQRALARELIRVVIETRPEIAQAWQAQQGAAAAPPLRRAVDLSPPSPPSQSPATASSPAASGAVRAQAETLVAAFVAETVEQRLQVFRVAAPRFPSAAYCHEQPFFLFSGVFAKVVTGFFSEVLTTECRDTCQRHVYGPLEARGALSSEQVEGYMSARRVEVVRILIERLNRLAPLHRAAEAKLAKAKADGEAGAAAITWKTIEVPVSQPRMLRVLGVQFAVGRQTAMRKVRVKAGAENEIQPAEMETLTLITRLRDMAADSGIDLPAACDFRFLAALLDFDFRRFAQSFKDLVTAAAVDDRTLLFERVDAIDKLLPDSLADAALIMLFSQQAERGFGFQDLYEFSVSAQLGDGEPKPPRPFLAPELARRPRELAFQVREVLRRQGDEECLAAAVQALLMVWQVLPKSRFAADLEAALTVLAAFPVAFAGDPDEAVFIEIGEVVRLTLAATVPNWDRCLLAVRAAYYPALKRRKLAQGPKR